MTGRCGAILIVALSGALATGCGVPTDDEASSIPAERVPYGLLEPELTPSVPTSEVPEAARSVDVYFVREDQLAPMPRSVRQVEPARLLAALLAGPSSDEEAQGVRSAVTPDGSVGSVRGEAGIVDVDLGTDFTELATAEQRLALAQLVFTLTEAPTIEAVRFTLDGRPTSVPRGDGTASDGPLRRIDYQQVAP
jgi:spore germination protein GerM